jgi:hypothetical protein
MGDINEEFIERGAKVPEKKRFLTGRITHYMPWAGSAAACLAVVAVLSFSGVLRFNRSEDQVTPKSALPTAESGAEIAAAAAEEAVEEAVIEEEVVIDGSEAGSDYMPREYPGMTEASGQQPSAGNHRGGVASTESEVAAASDTTPEQEGLTLTEEILVDKAVDPDLNLRNITLAEARADTNFGRYIPESSPPGFAYEDGIRITESEVDTLQVSWSKGLDYLKWKVGSMRPELRNRTTGVAERENYDLSLYPIPMAESVPDELRQIVDHPIFLYDEMTLDTVYARSRYIDNDRGDTAGYRTDFGVLIGDNLIEITAKGLTPEEVWEMLQNVAKTE